MTDDVPGADAKQRPDPEAPQKPTSLAEISRPSWKYVASRTLREFLRDDCPDLAAGLTYYGVLAALPGLFAIISLLGVLGEGPESAAAVLDVAERVVPRSALAIVRPEMERVTRSPAATLGLVLGVLGALWFVSRYVAAFGRAMNRIYSIREGRPLWKLLPLMVLVTLVLGTLCFCAVVILLVSGPLARALGDVLGFGATAVAIWNIAKWPLLAAIVVVVVALLYYITPNVRQPRFRWLSPGAVVAITAWFGGSLLFGLYVSKLHNYDTTFGSLAGVIVLLVWLWVSNTALLLGAELDAEIERARELQAGIGAERSVQLPVRDTRTSDRVSAQEGRDVAAGRELRRRHSGQDVSED